MLQILSFSCFHEPWFRQMPVILKIPGHSRKTGYLWQAQTPTNNSPVHDCAKYHVIVNFCHGGGDLAAGDGLLSASVLSVPRGRTAGDAAAGISSLGSFGQRSIYGFGPVGCVFSLLY